MPPRLRRIYGKGDLHFITCSCKGRRPFLGSAERRDWFLSVLELVRERFDLGMIGYVVMPEHFHLLMEEHAVVTVSAMMQQIKQRYARLVPESPVWEPRFYDFNVWSGKKVEEKLSYMHLNPMRRGLVRLDTEWVWSSARWYAGISGGVVEVGPERERLIPGFRDAPLRAHDPPFAR